MHMYYFMYVNLPQPPKTKMCRDLGCARLLDALNLLHIIIVIEPTMHTPCGIIQWNLRIKDKLVHGPLSTIRRLSFIGGKGPFSVLLFYV